MSFKGILLNEAGYTPGPRDKAEDAYIDEVVSIAKKYLKGFKSENYGYNFESKYGYVKFNDLRTMTLYERGGDFSVISRIRFDSSDFGENNIISDEFEQNIKSVDELLKNISKIEKIAKEHLEVFKTL